MYIILAILVCAFYGFYIGKKKTYDYVLFHVKRKDEKYIIYLIRGANIVDNKNLSWTIY